MSNNQPLEIKIILLGETAVGKTSIINRYIKNEFDPNVESNISMCFISKIIEKFNKKIKLNIWDTVGQERFRSMSKLFLNNTKIVILVYSITSKQSFDNLDYWLSLYKNQLEEGTILGVAGNKADLILEQKVPDETGREYALKNGAIFGLLSAKENKRGIDLFLDKLIEAYLNGQNFGNNDEIKSVKLSKKIENNQKNTSCCGGGNNVKTRRYNTIVQQYNGLVNSIFLGDNNVGKTSIINRIIGKEYNKNEQHTKKINEFLIIYKNQTMKIKLKIYDIDIDKKKERDFIKVIKNCNIYFLIYDIKIKQSLENLRYWIEAIREIKENEINNESYLLYIIGNKDDLSFEVDEKNKEERIEIKNIGNKYEKYIEEGKNLSKEYNGLFRITSALENKGIENIINESMEKFLTLS